MPVIGRHLKPAKIRLCQRLAFLGELARGKIERPQVAIVRDEELPLVRNGDEIMRSYPPAVSLSPLGVLIVRLRVAVANGIVLAKRARRGVEG